VTRFSECFFLIFGQLAVGGVFGLAVPDFRALERGFYKSSAGIFLGFGVVFLVARASLVLRADALPSSVLAELLAWSAFLAAFGAYLASLWSDAGPPRARAFSASALLGLAALIASAFAYRPTDLAMIPLVIYAIPFVAGAAMLGMVTTGMLLGHWYLIDLGLSIEPLARVHRVFARATICHLSALVSLAVGAWILAGATSPANQLLADQAPVFAIRLLLGPIPTLTIAFLIHRTLQIPQTMAATGLFYVAILFALVGEMVGRLVLFRTGLPL